MDLSILLVVLVGLFTDGVLSGELTFELPDNEKMCFHETIDKGVSSTLEFQVVMGGNYDVDMELTAPNNQILYKDVKKQYDSFTWTADLKGVYTFCFSNEFSTFTHKVVYFDLQVGDEKPVVETMGEHASAMTLMETLSANMHGYLAKILNFQVFLRHKEAAGKAFIESLNSYVLMMSAVETVAILLVGLGQVFVLRSFFSGPSPRSSANGRIST